MPLPPALHASPRNLVLAGLSALLLAAYACTGEPGATPDCKPDTSPAGITPTDNGCDGFAQCLDASGKPADARAVCCKDLQGSELQTCLFGYGAAAPPGGGSSASGSTSAASGSSSSSGSAGGGG